jgi:hypothetical protein
LFRRNKSESESTAAPVVEKVGGKGRPTPSRKEAEAAAKARAKVPRSRKEQSKAQRAQRTEQSQKVRQAMKTGDEKYYLPRDKGPVKRFVRDFVDSRFSFIELMLPLLLITMFMTYSGSPQLAGIGNTVLLGTVLLVLVDVLLMRRRLRRQLALRFPDESPKGTTSYAVMRSLQMKFMRLPKAQVKIGQDLPEHYR